MTGFALSLVQLVTTLTIAHAPCPAYRVQLSCYVPETQTIYMSPRDERAPWSRFALLHEYGHAYDFQRLDDGQRARFERLLGFPAARGWWQEGAPDGSGRDKPGEVFADAYAHCAMGFFPWYADRREARICPLLPRSASGRVQDRLR